MREVLALSDVYTFLNGTNTNDKKVLNITVLHNITLDPFFTLYLTYYGIKLGFRFNVKYSGLNHSYHELLDENDFLIDSETDFIIIAYNFQYQKSIKNPKSFFRTLIDNVFLAIRSKTNASIIWHSFEKIDVNYTISDSQNKEDKFISYLNNYLKKKINNTTNSYFLNMDFCLKRIGVNNFYDFRFYYTKSAPYTLEAIDEICFEDIKYIRSVTGKTKKCLVLDCDNILWGGILGELGMQGINIGASTFICPYAEFQKEIVDMYERGIFIALCSKNNEDEVLNVLQNHPGMVLKEEHIATYQINWDDKATNIHQISKDLNIALDSIVFIDDNEFETELVKKAFPEIEVLHFDKSKPHIFRRELASCGLFESLHITEEDLIRNKEIKNNIKRENAIKQFFDFNQYLSSLEIEIKIKKAGAFDLPRVLQLINKTNQFNLTLKRYNSIELEQMFQSESYDILIADFKDKFGYLGVIGVCILKYESLTASIEVFLMSCRALGRKVEEVFLYNCLKIAEKKSEIIIGEYVKSSRNVLVKDFYDTNDFVIKSEDDSKVIYRKNGSDCQPNSLELFKQVLVDFN